MRGPIDYIIVGFEGNKFDGSVLATLANAIDDGVIALVTLAVVMKDEASTVTQLNIADLGDAYITEFTQKYAPDTKLATSDDIDEVGDLLEPNTAAGLLVVEQLWAIPLKKALLAANGTLIAEGRIHPEAAKELNAQGEK
jgi:hypothetical protein